MIFNQNDKININVSDISKLTTEYSQKSHLYLELIKQLLLKKLEKFDFIYYLIS